MRRVFTGAAVPRHAVFILSDGAFVVQWDEARVQELLTGRYRRYDRRHFGHHITDYELNQLKAAGRVEHFNRSYVWLYALPEQNRFSRLKSLERSRGRVRAYYLNTNLSQSQYAMAERALEAAGLADRCCVQMRDDQVAIVGADGRLITELPVVEGLQKQLRASAADLFHNTVVAFVDVQDADSILHPELEQSAEPDDLATLFASQTDTRVTQGKRVVLVCRGEEEQRFLAELCDELLMQVRTTLSAVEALAMLEDERPDLLMMQMELLDMHGWELLGKLKEAGALNQVPVIALAEYSTSTNQQAFALTVPEVEVFLIKPISRARLRQNIWMVMAARA